MTRKIPENFTLALALVDTIPCIFFGISMGIVYSRYPDTLFLIGAILSTLAGFGKVIWKLVIVFAKKDVPIFFYQFRALMPGGSLLMLFSCFINRINLLTVLTKKPGIYFFILAIVLMMVLIMMAKKLDKNSAKANWIEQASNILCQGLVLLGVLFY